MRSCWRYNCGDHSRPFCNPYHNHSTCYHSPSTANLKHSYIFFSPA
nr:MAG TPA_asm: hypothetical protein [Caudoviricetes sp.]